MGTIKYIQVWDRLPLNSAGPNDLAGFMEAPVSGPPTKAARVSVATLMITNISTKLILEDTPLKREPEQ
jgi:hypothetical protein